MALFAIAMLAIIPALTQAARNMRYAQETAEGHMQAHRLMLVIRDAIADDVNLELQAASYVASDFEYSVWIIGEDTSYFSSINAPITDVSVTGVLTNLHTHASTIVVIVWGDDDKIIGRAIGMTDFL